MRELITTDNLFRVGTLIKARVEPDLQLKIMSYNQRIYYCGVVSDPKRKQLVFYERELIPPVLTDQFKPYN
jgi:hypothetical protein